MNELEPNYEDMKCNRKRYRTDSGLTVLVSKRKSEAIFDSEYRVEVTDGEKFAALNLDAELYNEEKAINAALAYWSKKLAED